MRTIELQEAKRLHALGYERCDANQAWWVDDGTCYGSIVPYHRYWTDPEFYEKDLPRYPYTNLTTAIDWIREEHNVYLVAEPVYLYGQIMTEATLVEINQEGVKRNQYIGQFAEYETAMEAYLSIAISLLEYRKKQKENDKRE